MTTGAPSVPAENRLVSRIGTLLRRNSVPHEIWRPATLQEAGTMARKAAEKSLLVAAAGGDGTVNAVAAGLAGTGCCLGVLPAGSGNDIARGLLIPRKLSDAISILAAGYRTLQSGGQQAGQTPSASIRKLDTGSVRLLRRSDSGRDASHAFHTPGFFINTLGFGFDGRVAWNASRMPAMLGKWKYLAGVLQSLFTYRASQMTITTDGETWSGRYLLAAVANGPVEGGGILIAPEADFGDGLFHLVMIRDTGVLARIPLLLRVLMYGTSGSPHVRVQKCRAVSVVSDRPLMAHADGEVLADGLFDFTAEIHPARLTVVGGTKQET